MFSDVLNLSMPAAGVVGCEAVVPLGNVTEFTLPFKDVFFNDLPM
jgi:hypothetical protein